MTTKTIEDLHTKIERLVREHLAEQRKAATAAVERAFAAPSRVPSRPSAAQRTTGRRRPADEMHGLADRLYESVRANPGATMITIAPMLGATARALNRPMLNLKRAGRVRSAGQKHQTRYFPMTSKSA